MRKKLSHKQFFLLLYLSTVAFGVTVFRLSNLAMMGGKLHDEGLFYGLLRFLWPFGIPVILIAIFFVVVAIPRARIAFAKLEIPNKYSPKHYLLLLWLTAQAFLLGVILHNGFYALGMITSHITPLSYLMEVLHGIFFFIAIPLAPAGFIVGAVGRLWEWAVVNPIDEMKPRGVQLPISWPYFAPIGSYVWLWKFARGVESITDNKIRAAGVFASVFFLGIIGLFIIRYTIHRRLEKA